MPAMRWDDFHESHYRPHLVVAELIPPVPGSPRARVTSLQRLVVQLGTIGNYSIREEQGAIEVAFERDVDAGRFSEVLGARRRRGGSDWASRSRFRFDRVAQQRIVNALRVGRLKLAKRPNF